MTEKAEGNPLPFPVIWDNMGTLLANYNNWCRMEAEGRIREKETIEGGKICVEAE